MQWPNTAEASDHAAPIDDDDLPHDTIEWDDDDNDLHEWLLCDNSVCIFVRWRSRCRGAWRCVRPIVLVSRRSKVPLRSLRGSTSSCSQVRQASVSHRRRRRRPSKPWRCPTTSPLPPPTYPTSHASATSQPPWSSPRPLSVEKFRPINQSSTSFHGLLVKFRLIDLNTLRPIYVVLNCTDVFKIWTVCCISLVLYIARWLTLICCRVCFVVHILTKTYTCMLWDRMNISMLLLTIVIHSVGLYVYGCWTFQHTLNLLK